MANREFLIPVPRAKACTLAAEQIKERILDGTWRPGDRLPPERELATQLAISRGTTREALRILEAIGWLEIKPGEGAIVVDVQTQTLGGPIDLPLPAAEIGDIWEMRKLIEPGAAYLAAERCSDEDLQAIEDTVRQAEAAAENGQPIEAFNANPIFHLAVAKATGNPMVVYLLTLLLEASRKANKPEPGDADNTPERSTRNLAEHRRIFEAIKSGQPAAAEKASFNHLVNSWMAHWGTRSASRH